MAAAATPEPTPPPSIRVSITVDGVEIESSHPRDTLTRVANLAARLWSESRTARPGISAGMGFTTEIRVDDVADPDGDDVDQT